MIRNLYLLEKLATGEMTEKEAYTHEYKDAVERLKQQDKGIRRNYISIAFDAVGVAFTSVYAGYTFTEGSNYGWLGVAVAAVWGAFSVIDIKKNILYRKVRVQYAQEKDDLEAKLQELGQ